MHKQLKKAIDLSRKTGDRIIVYDINQDDSTFVVMNLDEYEKLALPQEIHNLTEDELLDKINCDIAQWKSEQFETNVNSKSIEKEPFKQWNRSLNFSEKLDDDYQVSEEKKPKVGKSGHWKIPEERKENAEEVIEEDRQYLEEV